MFLRHLAGHYRIASVSTRFLVRSSCGTQRTCVTDNTVGPVPIMLYGQNERPGRGPAHGFQHRVAPNGHCVPIDAMALKVT